MERELAESISAGRNDPRQKWQGDEGSADPVCEGMTTEIEILENPFICHADQQSVITEIAERVRLTNERLEIYLLRNRLHEHRLARCLRR